MLCIFVLWCLASSGKTHDINSKPEATKFNNFGFSCAAFISASVAGFYAAEAQKNYGLSNAILIPALHYERQADSQERQDEQILLQATIAQYYNQTQVEKPLLGKLSQEAKDSRIYNKESNTFNFSSLYYTAVDSKYAAFDQSGENGLEHADIADSYSRLFIIITSVLSAGVVAFSEFTKVKV
jgi:hypothetical protein